MYVIAGLPAELPKFTSKRPLGDVLARSLQDADDDNVRSASSSVAAAGTACGSEAVTSATCSANDSSMIDIDMDETC